MQMHALCEGVFMDYNADSFNSVLVKSVGSGYAVPILDGLKQAIAGFEAGKNNFAAAVNADPEGWYDEDLLDYFNDKASALIDNIDMLAGWCMFKRISHELDEAG